MRFKENITYIFGANGTLDIYNKGHHEVSQPFDSDTGAPFVDLAHALAWAARHFPDYFTT
jgi:hypothetical protein